MEQPNQPYVVGDYTVTPLRATHDRNEFCLFYHIAKGGKSILYAHDTGAFTRENFDCLLHQPRPLSVVSMDCTMMRTRNGNNHMGLLDAAEQKEKLLQLGIADEHTIWVVNHFSHNGGWLHDELCEQAGNMASSPRMTRWKCPSKEKREMSKMMNSKWKRITYMSATPLVP